MIPDLVIPLAIFLIPLLLFLGLYFLYAIFNIYHLMRFGVYNVGAYIFTAVFVGGTLVLVGFSLFLLSPYDWAAPFNAASIFQSDMEDVLFPL